MIIAEPYTNETYSKILQVSGDDAAKFLQGQLSCDVTIAPTYGAYCDLKGRVVCFFLITHESYGFGLSMPDSMLPMAMQELQKYVLRSKVKFNIVDNPDNRTNDNEQEILAKIPEIYPPTSGLFLPHDLNLPELGAVSFNKGCYRGQEIVARIQHRGKPKRSLQSFSSTNLNLHPGSVAKSAENHDLEVGTVVRVHQQSANKLIGLAVINNEYASNSLVLG